jgi:hypothetical protein
LLATAGREPPPVLPAPAFVAIAVGKTKEGESLPAKPIGCQLVRVVGSQCGGMLDWGS